MSEGLEATAGEAEVTPVVQTPAVEVPATEIPGQVAAVSSGAEGQPPAQVTEEDSLPGGMPLPPNWTELPDHQKQALKDSSAYWQTAMNGVAEKYKADNQADKGDADMFRQLCADPNLAKQFADARGGPVSTPATVPATAPAAPDIPENLYDMNREQLLGVVQTAVSNAQTGSQKELEGIKQQLQSQQVQNEFAALKVKFPDAEQYVSAMSPLWKQGYPLEHAYILAKAISPAPTNGLPAVAVSAVPPPDQTSVTSGSTAAIEESNADAFKGLSSFQILKKQAETDPEAAKAMAILDET